MYIKDTIDGTITLANKLTTARSITIGNATKTFNGSADISFTGDEIGMQSQVWAAGTTAPTNTKLLWIDTTANTGGLKYHNGSGWVHVPVAYT